MLRVAAKVLAFSSLPSVFNRIACCIIETGFPQALIRTIFICSWVDDGTVALRISVRWR